MSSPADLFIADLHLDRDTPARLVALQAFLRRHVRPADRLFVLGDLFNVWIGRKQLDEPHIRQACLALRHAAEAGAHIHFVAGNRDFYALPLLAQRAAMTVHRDGFHVDSLGAHAWLCHGHCLHRHDRRTRNAQTVTHSTPVEFVFQHVLPRRLGLYLARGYTAHSQRVVRHKTGQMLSISNEALIDLLQQGYDTVVCGHTHRLAHVVFRHAGPCAC